MSTEALCVGRHDLFDSVAPADHLAAAELCAACPLLDACAERLAEVKAAAKSGGGPQGTWAGQLIGGFLRPDCGTEAGYQWHRNAAEGRVRCADCKAAHSRHVCAWQAERRAERGLGVAS